MPAPAPSITAILPANGPIAGGTPVVITGLNFQLGLGVTFGGVPAASVLFISSTEVTVTTPPHVQGSVAVTLTNPDTQFATVAAGFSYEDQASTDWSYVIEPSPSSPVAFIAPGQQNAIVGSVVRLDGRASFSPAGLPLTYNWKFVQVPIGSQAVKDGFKNIEDDGSAVTFAPDVTGLYEVQLVVNDGSFDSTPALSEVTVKVVLVPHNQGIVPDTSWVWNYLSDFWTQVEQRGRFETFWSAAIQIIAAEQLKLWQYDYNKSIKDIQDLLQRRWLKYEPSLELDPSLTSFILADDQAGLNASTFLIDITSNTPQVPQPLKSNLVAVPLTEGNFTTTSYGSSIKAGRVLNANGQSYTLGRSGTLTRARGAGIDGATALGQNKFFGSVFTVDMVGMRLKILTGALAGTIYTIIGVPNSTTLQLQNLDGSPLTFAVALTGLQYSIYPAAANYSAFFADQSSVPAGQSGLPWRFSATLSSTQYDFEQQGVSPGDVIVVQVLRQDTSRSGTINLQVVAVDRNRVGFVLNTDDLVDGTPASGLSKEDQIALATALQVPGLMISTVTQDLVYTDQALAIQKTVSSVAFKRSVYETELTSDSAVNVGPFSVVFKPLRILRNSLVKIDDAVRSVPSLQEYVKQPELVEQDGQLFQVSEGKFYAVSHRPYTLLENLDYIIDDERSVSGLCNVINGSDVITVPFGDLVDRSIRVGDTLLVNDGVSDQSFIILSVVDPEHLRVSPRAMFTLAAANYRVERKVAGTFVRFVGGTFSKKSPAPKRLWAEVSFFDNNDLVEANFGVLVGVTREDLDKQGSTLSYKSSVAGLMYALTNGPTVSNLQLASQILLGLPFTQYQGVISEIDPEYRTRDDGSPLYGRIVVAATDTKNKPTGITSIYFYPQGRQIPDPANPGKWLPAAPDLSGLAINPDTGKEYQVGDSVKRFIPLSKGTQVQDYLNAQSWVQRFVDQGNAGAFVQQYHSFQLVVNADIVSAVDTDLVAQFLKRAKPTYTKLSLALFKSVEDVVEVEDAMLFFRTADVKDNVSLSLPMAADFDQQTVDGSLTTAKGDVLGYRIYGSDLVTTQGSLVVTSAAGGFVNARALESHDADFLRSGCILRIISGPNAGDYVITSILDTQLTLASVDVSGSSFEFQTATSQEFVVFYPMQNPVVTGTAAVVNGSQQISPNFGLFSTDVAPGDLLAFWSVGGGTLSQLYRVIAVDVVNEKIAVDRPVVEATATYNIGIAREGWLNQHFWYWPMLNTLAFNEANGSNTLTLIPGSIPDLFIPLVVFPGDVVVNTTTNEEFTVIDWDPAASRLYVTPPATTTQPCTGRLERQSRKSSDQPVSPIFPPVLSTDILDRIPADFLSLKLYVRAIAQGGSGPDLTTTAGSASVSTVSGLNFDTGLGVMPGDYLVVLEGADSTRDIGYGAGVFPILSISGTSMTLTRPLTATSAPSFLYGIQRRRANER